MLEQDHERFSRSESPVPLLLFLTGALALSFVATQLSLQALRDWYLGIEKPSWALPNWAFVPTWTLLSGLCGWAAFGVWSIGHRSRPLQTFFWLHLLLFVAWAGLFFILTSKLLALAAVTLASVCSVTSAYRFLRHSRLAAMIQLFQSLWLCYLGALTLTVL